MRNKLKDWDIKRKSYIEKIKKDIIEEREGGKKEEGREIKREDRDKKKREKERRREIELERE